MELSEDAPSFRWGEDVTPVLGVIRDFQLRDITTYGVPEWVELSESYTTGNKRITVSYKKNTFNKKRSCEIYFKTESASQTLTIIQEAADAVISLLFLQRTDIFRRFAEHISHVGSEINQGAAGCSIVADLDSAQVDDGAYGTVPRHGRDVYKRQPCTEDGHRPDSAAKTARVNPSFGQRMPILFERICEITDR